MIEGSGLFVILNDQIALNTYLKNGIYGQLLNKDACKPTSKNRFYAILADHACIRNNSEIFLVFNRKIYHGGTINIDNDELGFFINGKNSDYGIEYDAPLIWDESLLEGHTPTNEEGVFLKEGNKKCQPFIILFDKEDDFGKYVKTDDFYFELGIKYGYPLPSNSMSGMGFCTLTPCEVNILKGLFGKCTDEDPIDGSKRIHISNNFVRFEINFDKHDFFMSESHIEFTLLNSLHKLSIFKGTYSACRQVPLSPFKPSHIDRADICLYDHNNLIKEGSIPNIVIELKRDKAGRDAYLQTDRYLTWLEKITTPEEFDKIRAYIIAKDFVKTKPKLNHGDKIECIRIHDLIKR